MEETLKRFREQFEWHPIVENPSKLASYHSFIFAGMGGSHLGAWLIQDFGGYTELRIHRDYGLPLVTEERLRNTLFIASSYSGTTEETLDATHAAFDKGMHIAVVSTGGTLLDFAREHSLPFITIPDTGLEPRMAIGYSTLAIARLMGDDRLEAAIREGGKRANAMSGQAIGAGIAEKLIGKIPLVWSSTANISLAYIWKIKFNETSKIPAFYNAVPELCHNEFTGFDITDSTRSISAPLHVVMLEDPKDHPRIQKRMRIAREMLAERGVAVERVSVVGQGFEKAYSVALLGDWTSLALAQAYGVPDPKTPMVTEFKKRMAQ